MSLPILLAIAVSDIKTRNIPFGYSLFLMVLGVMRLVTLSENIGKECVMLAILFLIIYIVFRVTSIEGLGGGDVKLMLGGFFLLGPWQGAYAIFAGTVLALIVCVLKPKRRTGLALGPYLVMGILCNMAYQCLEKII